MENKPIHKEKERLIQAVITCYEQVSGAVVLLKPKSKLPLKGKSWKNSSVSLEEFRAHITQGGNYGIQTGTPSGIDVLDVDAPDIYPDLIHDLQARTAWVKTSRGFHFYFKHNPRVNRNKVDVGIHLDIRTDGGYIVGPGSIHETGAEYVLHGSLENLALWPDELLDKFFPKPDKTKNPHQCIRSADHKHKTGETGMNPYIQEALSSAAQSISCAQEGSRNSTLNKEAFSLAGLVACGLAEDVAKKELEKAALESGLPEDEVQRSLASAWEAGKQHPRVLPENLDNACRFARQFVETDAMDESAELEQHVHKTEYEEPWSEPVSLLDEDSEAMLLKADMLPACLGNWIFDAAERMQTFPDYMAVSALVILGNLLGRQLAIHPKTYDTTWSLTPNLWGLLVGQSSMMKSPAIHEALRFINAIDQEYEADYLSAMKEWERENEKSEVAKKRIINLASKEKSSEKSQTFLDQLPAAPVRPIRKRIFTNDTTIEMLQGILKENPNGILVIRDELAGWFLSFNKKGHENDRQFYLEGYNGNGRYTCDRLSRGTTTIEGLCLGVLGGATPGGIDPFVKEALSHGSGSDGLLQRFSLICYPTRNAAYTWVDRLPNRKAFEEAEQAFLHCKEINHAAIGAEKPSFSNGLPFLKFDAEAQKLFKDFYSNLQEVLRTKHEHPALESHILKQDKLVCGLALIFHVVSGKTGPIGTSSLLPAIEWAKYAEAHARKLYGVSDPAKDLLRYIQNEQLKNGFTERDIKEKGWSVLKDQNTITAALNHLIESGHIRAAISSSSGRPTTRFTIHPKYRNLD